MKLFFAALSLVNGLVLMTGCSSVTVYQSPVTQFQTSINSANAGVKTYLLSVNDVIAKANLYDKLSETNQPSWTLNDLNKGISKTNIDIRLNALQAVFAYANALGAVAQSKDVGNLQQAAKVLGTNVNHLNQTLQSAAGNKAAINVQEPVTALVKLLGTLAIEKAQKAELEKAIIDASTNVDLIIEHLTVDLADFSSLVDTSENAIWEGKLKIYNQLRKSASPKDLDALITQLVTDYDSIQTLRLTSVGSVLQDMENAHKALVVFTKSKKTPKDLAELAGAIEVFSAHVQLFNDALGSIQKAATTAK